jgi:hypothetical protein
VNLATDNDEEIGIASIDIDLEEYNFDFDADTDEFAMMGFCGTDDDDYESETISLPSLETQGILKMIPMKKRIK